MSSELGVGARFIQAPGQVNEVTERFPGGEDQKVLLEARGDEASQRGFLSRMIVSSVAIAVVAALVGCAQNSENRARVERAKADFLAHQGRMGLDAAYEELDAVPPIEFSDIREFRDCSVRRASILEQFSVSPEVEFWAIELDFTGTDAQTGQREDGTAILLYRAFRQMGEEDRLIGIFPGTTEEEKGMIREGIKAAFDFLRQGLTD